MEAFRLPASLAVVPQILDKKYYTYGTSLNATLSTIVQLIGLGLAGIIIGAFGIGCAIAIDGISFFGSAFILSFLKIRENDLHKGKLHLKEYITTLKEGIFYLKDQPVIRNFCLLAVLINGILAPLNSLQSPLIYEILGGGSELLSVFSLALTAGMGIASFLYPFIAEKLSVRMQFIGLGILTGIELYGYPLGERFKSHTACIYALTITVSLLLGMTISIMTSALSVCFMKSVKQEYLARVGSIFNAGASAATPAISFAVSILTTFCPVAQIIRICALLCVIIFTVMAFVRVRLE